MSDKSVWVEPSKKVWDDRKKDIDAIVEELKGVACAQMEGGFDISFSHTDDERVPEHLKGFSITILPKGRDGAGICLKIDPYDIKSCSGISKVWAENGRTKFPRE